MSERFDLEGAEAAAEPEPVVVQGPARPSMTENIRRRPGMYIGDTDDGTGVRQLVWEVVGNAIDAHLAGRATELRLTITDGTVTVVDDGGGIPVDPRPDSGISLLETVLTRMHVTGTFDGHSPHLHVGPRLHGVGLVAVSALSERLEVETTRGGERWAIAVERGVVTTALHCLGPTTIAGTTVRFRPDPTIFAPVDFDLKVIRTRMTELAYMLPALRMSVQGRALAGPGGIEAWVASITGAALEAKFSVQRRDPDVHVDLTIGWRGHAKPNIRSFVNTGLSKGHGTHVAGMWRGLLTTVREAVCPDADPDAVQRLLSLGLVAIVHVELRDPRFANPSRDHLATPLAGEATERAIVEALPAAIARDPQLRAFLIARLT